MCNLIWSGICHVLDQYVTPSNDHVNMPQYLPFSAIRRPGGRRLGVRPAGGRRGGRNFLDRSIVHVGGVCSDFVFALIGIPPIWISRISDMRRFLFLRCAY